MAAYKIMLDAGHYGKYNQSPANKAYYESDFAFKFVNMLKAELEGYGFVVGTTRTEQAKDLALQSRGKAAKGYNLFISIHSNAVGSGVNETVDYPVAFTMVSDKKVSIDEVSKEVGEILAAVVGKTMGTTQGARTMTKQSGNDRDGNGVLDDEYYGVLHGAKLAGVPGIILEHSFHTNTRATNWLLDDSNLKKMAAAEAEALAEYYGMKKQENKAPAATTNKWYRVRKTWKDTASQLGAYQVYDNAVKACQVGYSVFDENGNVMYSNSKKHKAYATVESVAKEVIAGKWGNGSERKNRLTEAGYNYDEVQAAVNKLLKGNSTSVAKKSVEEVAREVIAGKWGNGNARKTKLTAAGYNYDEVQAVVNKLLRG